MAREGLSPTGGAPEGERDGAPDRGTSPRDEAGRGFSWEGADPAELRDVVEAAFDYRGDVTLKLEGGAELEGYLSNRDGTAEEPFVEVFPSDGTTKRTVLYRDIRGVSFTGKDTASGKSWETWVRKWEAKRAARARGEDVGEIGLYPDSLE